MFVKETISIKITVTVGLDMLLVNAIIYIQDVAENMQQINFAIA